MIFSANDVQFEIPDDWWCEAGMDTFAPSAESYCVNKANVGNFGRLELISLARFISPKREVPIDFRGFKKCKLMNVLREISHGDRIHPILAKAEADRFAVHDGFHRYYASVAAGYQKIPAFVGVWGV